MKTSIINRVSLLLFLTLFTYINTSSSHAASVASASELSSTSGMGCFCIEDLGECDLQFGGYGGCMYLLVPVRSAGDPCGEIVTGPNKIFACTNYDLGFSCTASYRPCGTVRLGTCKDTGIPIIPGVASLFCDFGLPEARGAAMDANGSFACPE